MSREMRSASASSSKNPNSSSSSILSTVYLSFYCSVFFYYMSIVFLFVLCMLLCQSSFCSFCGYEFSVCLFWSYISVMFYCSELSVLAWLLLLSLYSVFRCVCVCVSVCVCSSNCMSFVVRVYVCVCVCMFAHVLYGM
eukprot:GHVQ01018629.1.p1 GENE.GHVQ01018629.1~~GHVQ01018629.1.p1  ORF type:complete len:138 (-),score=24.87 GHVQ01018629.1:609-1022(-)